MIGGFKSSSDRLKDLNEFKKNIGAGMTFGNKFLDDSLDGIYPDDLVILTAKSGHGKTELAANIAAANALRGMKVHMFALEAYPGEIEARIKYKLLTAAFFTQKDWRQIGEVPRFQKWVYNKQDHLLSKFEPEVDDIIHKNIKSLNSYYRGESFSVEDFEGQMFLAARDDTNLVVVDHLHYFDLEGDDENRALKKTVKKIREIASFYRKPTVVVAHIRKQDRKASMIPDLDDIYGSSDISKISTKIIATARARDQESGFKNIFPTYVQVLKNRLDGSVCNFTALCSFDAVRNKYLDNYKLGKMKFGSDEFVQLDDLDLPAWSKVPLKISVEQTQMEMLNAK